MDLEALRRFAVKLFLGHTLSFHRRSDLESEPEEEACTMEMAQSILHGVWRYEWV